MLPAKALVPATVSISRSGTKVTLSWPDVGADAYQVWRDDANPYLQPGRACVAPACTVVTRPGYSDELSPGLAMRYYLVRSASLCGEVSDPSNRVGAFRFGLTPGGGH